jgi:PAS domain S-box-containing protein
LHIVAPEREALQTLALSHLAQRGELFTWITDETGIPFWVSPAWLAFAGRDPEKDEFTSWSESTHPDDRERVVAECLAAIRTRRPFTTTYRVRRADGIWRQVLSHGYPFLDEQGTFAGYVGDNHDVTEEHGRLEALRQAEATQQAMLDLMPAVVTVLDAEDRYRFVNRAWEQITGRTREEAIGHMVPEVIGPESGALVIEHNARARATGGPVALELVVESPYGTRFLLTERSPIPDPAGGPPMICGAGTDITELREQEAARQALETRLQQAQKLESLGRMAGGVAHDFNNLLTGVLGNVEVALGELPENSPAAGSVRRIQVAAQRAAALARQMLAYSGHAHMRFEPVDLVATAVAMRELLAGVVDGAARFALETDSETPRVLGDDAHLEQLLMNLVMNASEALGNQPGTVTVRLTRQRIDAEHACECVSGSRCRDGEYACIAVIDDGCGMDADTRRRVFDPFFTTKFAGRGLGLSTVLGVVRAHGGGIAIDSEPGRGSRFRVYLPALGATPATPPKPSEAEAGSAPCVLVVDDERTVRDLACSALARAGYVPLAASDGAEALALWRERRCEIGLVLADIAMPRLDGPNLVAELHALDPTLPVLLMSGNTGGHPRFAEAASTAAGVLEKPVRIGELVEAVRRTARAAPVA